MLIIFESEDGTGKTTLAKSLSNEINVPYMKLKNININDNESIKDNVSISTHSQIETITQLFENKLLNDVILDRFHISEHIYNLLFMRDYDIEYIYGIEERLSKFNDVIIIRCKTSYNKLRDRWKVNEKLLNIENLQAIMTLYDNWFKKYSKVEVIEIDTNLPYEFSLESIKYELSKRGIFKDRYRKRRWNHEETMIEISKVISRRGSCLNRQVGAVLTEDGYIVGVGYNGPPSGLDHCKTCIRRERNIPSGQGMELSRALHAEENAIQQSGIRNKSDKDLRIFCTDSPCISCMRKLINIGINKIYYINRYNDELAWQMAEEANIEMIKMED